MIFVDTSVWVAVTDKADQHHLEASRFFKQRMKNGTRWITSDYVLSETITRIRYNVGHRLAVEAIKRFNRAAGLDLLRIVKIDDPLRQEAEKIFIRYDDQLFSFVDCASFALCIRESITQVFTFDRDFQIMKFTTSP